MRKIIGLDIGSGVSTAFLLEKIPTNIREFVQSEEFTPFEVKLCHEDLQALVNLKPDLVVFEPTGEHYEQVFCHWLERHGITYKRAVGRRVAAFRSDKGLPKTDGIDGFALALYGAIKLNPNSPDYDPKAFIPPCELGDLRGWWLQRHGGTRRRARLVARFRQELAKCIPEAQKTKLDRGWGDETPPLILWLTGELTTGRAATQWKNVVEGGKTKRKGVVPGTCGLGVTPGLVAIARELLQTDQILQELEQKIDGLLSEERFKPYLKAFETVGGSRNMMAIYLTRIYPFQRFMGEDGKPIIQTLPSKKTGKLCSYDRSLSQFKAAIGAGTRENTSGTRQKRENRKRSNRWKGKTSEDQKPEMAIGDRYCRKAFFLWGNAQIEGVRGRLNTKDSTAINCDRRLISHSEELEKKERNAFQRLGNLQGYHAKLLYKALLKELSK